MFDIIKKDIEILRKIKICDDAIYDFNDQYNRIEYSNRDVFNRLRVIDQKISDIDEFIKGIQLLIDEKNSTILEIEKSIDVFNSKNDGCDGEECKEKSEEIDSKLLSINVLKKEIRDNNVIIESKKKEKKALLEEKDKLEDIEYEAGGVYKISSSILDINRNKNDLLKQLSADVYKKYNYYQCDVSERKVLSSIEYKDNLDAYFCCNCYIQVTLQRVIDVIEAKKIVECEICGCIFVEVIKN